MTPLAWPRLRLLLLVTSLAVAWPAADAAAQDRTYDPPAHISFVDGAAVLERDGSTDTAPASMPLLAGDRLRTQSGRVEVLFADGATLHLDANTVVDFQSDEVMRLLEGRVRLNIPGPSRDVGYRIDAPAAWVQISEPGEFRVSLVGGAREPELEVAVLRGAAELVNEDGRTPLRAGERAFARAGAAPSYAYVFNSASWDAFDQWSEARRNERLGAYGEYLPSEVRPYGATLARYGTWRHEPSYGHVWYPTVPVGWRPYYYGRWSTLRPYGWTWIGSDPWAWPTHHYGRWGFSAGVWFWIPGRHWGPAWVSWGYAPGYVSWCPLGWNNRPVFSFINVNIFGGRRFHPWHGWTVLPHRRFGSGFVHRNVVNVTHIDARTRNSFVFRDTAPDYRGYAMPRAQAPIRVAGTRSGIAVPRGASGSVGSSRSVEPRRDAATEAAEVFRGRRSATEAQRSQGFPASARDPRVASPIRQAAPRAGSPAARGSGAATAQPERRDSTPARGERGAVRRAAPRSGPDAVPVPQSPPSRSAQPERRPPGGSRAVPGRAEPSQSPSPPVRRAVPQSERAPRGGAEPPAQRTPVPSVEYYRGSRREASPAAPSERQSRPDIRRAPSAPERAPSSGMRAGPPEERRSGGGPSRGPAIERRAPSAPERAPSSGMRADPPAGRPPGGAPSRGPAVERRAPGPSSPGAPARSGPAASAPAPGRPSSASPPSRSDSRGASRSRGGQQSSRSARPRGGGPR